MHVLFSVASNQKIWEETATASELSDVNFLYHIVSRFCEQAASAPPYPKVAIKVTGLDAIELATLAATSRLPGECRQIGPRPINGDKSVSEWSMQWPGVFRRCELLPRICKFVSFVLVLDRHRLPVWE